MCVITPPTFTETSLALMLEPPLLMSRTAPESKVIPQPPLADDPSKVVPAAPHHGTGKNGLTQVVGVADLNLK